MAITFHQQPQLFTPASNPVMWVFSSDQTGQPNFSFKVQLWINGALFGTYELYPMQGTFCKFEASEYVRSFVATHIQSTGGFPFESQDQGISVQIYVFESYGTPPEIITASEERSEGNYVFNGAVRYQQFYEYNYQRYWLNFANGMQPKMMTYFPDSEKQFTPYIDPFLVGILAERALQYYELTLEIYDIIGTMTYTYTDVIDLDFIVNMLDISPTNMDANGWTSGTEWDDCYYYEVILTATQSAAPFTSQSTERFRLYLDRSCSRFDDMRLYWVNKFGVVDQYSFNKLSIQSSNVNTYDYQVQPGVWGEGFYDFNLNAPEKKVAVKTAEDRITINSDWMKPAVQNWLVRELYESPQVWLYKDGAFQPVIVENNQNVLKSRFKDGLIQETVNLVVTWSYRSQLN
jgi:hypothetical protein